MKVRDRKRPELGNIVEWIKMREPEGNSHLRERCIRGDCPRPLKVAGNLGALVTFVVSWRPADNVPCFSLAL